MYLNTFLRHIGSTQKYYFFVYIIFCISTKQYVWSKSFILFHLVDPSSSLIFWIDARTIPLGYVIYCYYILLLLALASEFRMSSPYSLLLIIPCSFIIIERFILVESLKIWWILAFKSKQIPVSKRL